MRSGNINLEDELFHIAGDMDSCLKRVVKDHQFKKELLSNLGDLVWKISDFNKLYYQTYSERFPLYLDIVNTLTDIETEIEESYNIEAWAWEHIFEKQLNNLAEECREFYFSPVPNKDDDRSAPKVKIPLDDIDELIEFFNGFTGHDNKNPGNKSIINVSTSKLESLDSVLQIAKISQEIPNWSKKTIRNIKGAKAILEELWPIFKPFAHRIAKTWNKVLKGLAIQIEEAEDEDT